MREKKVIPTNMQAARQLAEELLDEAPFKGYSEPALFAIRLALEEGLANAIKHGNKSDPGKSITVCAEVDDDQATITITDEGEGFEPGVIPDPTVDENLEKPCGRGIMLMRSYMDKVEFNERGNEVRLIKRRA